MVDELWGSVKRAIDDGKEQDFFIDIGKGKYWNYTINEDLKHVLFSLSRYKYVSKLLMYKKRVEILELGCNEALGALMLDQELDLAAYTGIDFDPDAIKWNKENFPPKFSFYEDNFLNCVSFMGGMFDAVISLDVIEHINKEKEEIFINTIISNLKEDGVAVIGTPHINMSPYSSPINKKAHVNLYDQKGLYELLSKYFGNVFIFNMNDEVVHTGFGQMSCYIFAVCCGKRNVGVNNVGRE